MENNQAALIKLTLGPYGTNAYVIINRATQQSILIDAPAEADTLLEKLAGTSPQYIIITHSHFDHTGALKELKSKLGIPLIAHEFDAGNLPVYPDILVHNDLKIFLGELSVNLFHTPGHTPGSICLLIENYLISGDTIFPGGPGHTDTPDDFRQIIDTIKNRIIPLPENVEIFPGHGDKTTISEEKRNFLIFNSKKYNENLHGDVLWLS